MEKRKEVKKFFGSNLFLIAGIVVIALGGIEFYQTSVSPRLHDGVDFPIG